MNKKIVVTRFLLSGHLICCFNSSLFAGNLLAPDSLGSVGALSLFQTQTLSPASGLQFFLKQASSTDKPLAFTLKQTDDDKFDDRFDDENKTKAFDKHDEPDDFDKLSMPFEYDSEDESELSPDNKREDSARDHVILEWNDTEQKITHRQVHVQTHELTEEKHLHVNIDLTAELAELKEELKAPEINATSIALPRASSRKSVYPVTENKDVKPGKSDDSDSDDSDSEGTGSEGTGSEGTRSEGTGSEGGGSKGTRSEGIGSEDAESEGLDDSSYLSESNDSVEPINAFAEELPLSEKLIQAAIDRGRADDGLTYIQLGDIRHGQHHYFIDNEDILHGCSLTEAGATELQAVNTQLFATPEAAITAFEALKQEGVEKKRHTLEYQMLAKLIYKYKGEQEKAISNFFSSEQENTDYLFACMLDHSYLKEQIYRSLLKPLQMIGDGENILVICYEGISGMGDLTEAGSTELHYRHSDLFKSKDAAGHFWNAMELGLKRSTRREYISTHHYQAIARLIQEYEQAGNVEFILTGEFSHSKPKKYRKRSHSASDDDASPPRKSAKTESSTCSENSDCDGTYIDTIPYGMLRHGYLSFEGRYDGERRVSYESRKNYGFFLKSTEWLRTLKNFIYEESLSPDQILYKLKMLFAGDITLDSLMEDTECLLGRAYGQAKKSFELHCSQMNRPAEDDRPNAPENEHSQPDQED